MIANQLLENGAVFGNTRIVRRIGRGGTGEVYLARHLTLDRDYAIKVLKPEVADENPEFVERFVREARLSVLVVHPNLIAVHDAGRDTASGLYYIVMDYVPGGSLRDLMRRMPKIAPPRALNIVRQVAEALAEGAKHALVHRDVKPENILFAADGRALLGDLGIAKSAEGVAQSNTVTLSVFGTPAYMSPEQAKDASKVDGRGDLFSLGVILHEMLVGARPYGNAGPSEVLARLGDPDPVPPLPAGLAPDSVARLVADLCEKAPDRRVPSAKELVRRIDECLADEAMRNPTDDQPTVPVGDGCRRSPGQMNRRLRLMLVLLAALTAMLIAIAFVLSLDDDTPPQIEMEETSYE